MKILYLQSPYKRIYRYLEKWIYQAFQENNLEIIKISYPYNRKNVEELIKEHNPDWLFTLVGRKRKELFDLFSYIKLPKVGWFLEDPYFMEETTSIASLFSLIITVEEAAMSHYQTVNQVNSYYLPLGYDPATYYPQPVNDPQYKSDLCLAGYPYLNRVSLIKEIVQKTDWKLTVIGGKWARELNKWVTGKNFNCIDYWIPPEKVALYYSNAKIVLNPHRPINTDPPTELWPKSPNNRCFEAAACKVLQVCDYRSGIEELFHSETKMPTYCDTLEAINIMDYYLHDQEQRTTNAVNLYKFVQEKHTYFHRIERICSLVKQHL